MWIPPPWPLRGARAGPHGLGLGSGHGRSDTASPLDLGARSRPPDLERREMKERLRAPAVGWRAEDGPRGDELAAGGVGIGGE